MNDNYKTEYNSSGDKEERDNNDELVRKTEYSDGEVEAVKEYENGEEVRETSYLDGEINVVKEYENGKITKRAMYDDNEILSITEYENGEPVSDTIYSDGEVSSIMEYENGEPARNTGYFDGEVGSIMEFENGEPVSDTIYSDGEVNLLFEYINEKDTTTTSYFDGKVDSVREYKNGEMVKKMECTDEEVNSITKYENGEKVKTTEYSDGEVSSVTEYENDAAVRNIVYSDGEVYGVFEYENGETVRSTRYSDGEADYVVEHKDGERARETNYIKGEVSSVTEYENGKAVRAAEYPSNKDGGYIYVLVNSSIANMVKIGKTTRTPEERAKEISSTTGVPTPFIVAYESYFNDCSKAEKYIHSLLEKENHRTSKQREFFNITSSHAIKTIMEAKEYFEESVILSTSLINAKSVVLDELDYKQKKVDEEKEVFELAETYYHGLKNKVQDYEQAMIYYLKAIELGSLKGYIAVGKMYQYGEGVDQDIKKASEYFKEGGEKGNNECYAEMAILMEEDYNTKEILEYWKKYFELSEFITNIYGLRYMIFIYDNHLELQYRNKLVSIKNDIILDMENEILEAGHEILSDIFRENIRKIQFLFEEEPKARRKEEKKKSGFFSFFS